MKKLMVVLLMIMVLGAVNTNASNEPCLFGLKWGMSPSECNKIVNIKSSNYPARNLSENEDVYTTPFGRITKLGPITLLNVTLSFYKKQLHKIDCSIIENYWSQTPYSVFEILKPALKLKYGEPDNGLVEWVDYNCWRVGDVSIVLDLTKNGYLKFHYDYLPIVRVKSNDSKKEIENLQDAL